MFDWEDQIIISHLFRCVRQGDLLRVELHRYLLPPLDDSFHKSDTAVHNWTEFILETVIRGTIGGIVAMGHFLEPFADTLASLFREGATRYAVDENPLFNYGSHSSLRELVAGKAYHQYFQKVDADSNIKTVDVFVLNRIISFLEEHGIDTSDVKERSVNILNQGIIVQGGDVKAKALAVGRGAKADVNKTSTA